MMKFAIKNAVVEWMSEKAGAAKVFADVDSAFSTPLISRALSFSKTPSIVVFPVLSEAEKCAELLPFWLSLAGCRRDVFAVPETVIGERFLPESEAARASILNKALTAGMQSVFVASVSALLAPAPSPESLASSKITLKVGGETPMGALLDSLVKMDYDDELECGVPGEFSRRGGILDIFSPASAYPARLEFFGDIIESIRLFDRDTQRTFKRVEEYEIIPKTALIESGDCCLLDYFHGRSAELLVVSPERCAEHLSKFETERTESFWKRVLADDALTKKFILDPTESHSAKNAEKPDVARTAHLLADSTEEAAKQDAFHAILRSQLALERVKQWLELGYDIIVSAPTTESRLAVEKWIAENGLEPESMTLTKERIPFGLTFPKLRKVVVTERELLTTTASPLQNIRPPRFEPDSAELGDSGSPTSAETPDAAVFADLEPGDYAVHFEHGICLYKGVSVVKDDGVEKEMFELEFADDVTVYVPMSQANMLSKYIGTSKDLPTLTKKGEGKWLKTKLAAARDIKEMAEGLLRLQAMRLRRKGREFRGDPVWERLFEQSFPFEETPDQIKAAEAVKADMVSPRPMDRLVCGDVGYGKTEIAMRAAFKAVADGCQVAVMVPTTILAQQHFISFAERFAGQPVLIEMLSRFKTHAEQKETLARLAEGKVDIVIGTHRLAQKDVAFANLGLVIIDEEQRFGVRHKERLKHLKATVDVLTMTATPIPRTLYMAMTGLRDLSAISTPPNKRLPVRTFVCREELSIAARAIEEELERGGQVFYLHNRVKTIEAKLTELSAAVPSARFAAAHGQMEEGELESVMSGFISGDIDVLVCTTIIESGLDIPNANTIIIDRADRFGLSELYQLRGRVGRWHRQAYAYLFLPAKDILTGTARKRLAAIRRYSELGSGFRLALRDLEIRGCGNLLGAKQSGHINLIGFDLYCRLLRSAVAEEAGKPAEFAPSATVALDFVAHAKRAPKGRLPATIPASYIPCEKTRLGFFKRLGNAAEENTVDELLEEMSDRFGQPPKYVLNLSDLERVRILTAKAGYARLSVKDGVVNATDGPRVLKIDGVPPNLKSKSPSAKLEELIEILRAVVDGTYTQASKPRKPR